MATYVYDAANDKLNLVAGATLYADVSVGFIGAFDSTDIPSSFLEFKGQTVNRADYPDLWAHIVKNSLFGEGKLYGIGDGSTTFTLADLRETSLKGYGETSRSVGAHVKSGGLGIGEFIDDQLQAHAHGSENYTRSNGAGGAYSYVTQDDSGTGPWIDPKYIIGGRSGTTTEVKAVGVVWAVKAKQTGLPIDLKAEVEKIATKFPDYAHPITIPLGTFTWTATQDCYLEVIYITADTSISINSRRITIDGSVVGVTDATTNVVSRTFNGYVKKGQVVSTYDQSLNLGDTHLVKVFPLSS